MAQQQPGDPEDEAADTGRFQAFAEAEEPRGSPNRFRALTLIGGLVVFVAIAFLLLR